MPKGRIIASLWTLLCVVYTVYLKVDYGNCIPFYNAFVKHVLSFLLEKAKFFVFPLRFQSGPMGE